MKILETIERINNIVLLICSVVLITVGIEVARASASKSYRNKIVLKWEARHPIAYAKMMTGIGEVDVVDIFMNDPVLTFKAGVSAVVGSIIEENKKEEARRKKYLGG